LSVYDRNKGVFGARPNYWIKYVVPGVGPVREPGSATLKASKAWEAELRRQIKAGTWVHPSKRGGGSSRFDSYARTVLTRRIARGVVTAAKDERGHIENHLIPMFGTMLVSELSFRVIKDKFARYLDGKHAGRTVRNIHSTLRSILIEAAEDALIVIVPAPLSSKRDHLPPPRDKDPKWRKGAQFERGEIAQILSCEAVLSMHRVLYATYFLTGSRAMEVLPLTVDAYIRMDPWPCLAVLAEKGGRHAGEQTRYVPVHPELAAWLDWWLEHEYAVLAGHLPRPTDPLFPNISTRRTGEQFMSHSQLYKQWQRHDLPAVGLRHRRLHDARRTLVSVLRSAGVSDNAIRAVTHSSTADRILDAYTTWQWADLCRQLEGVSWGLPTPPRPKGTEGTNGGPTVGTTEGTNGGTNAVPFLAATRSDA
jgi:integrase